MLPCKDCAYRDSIPGNVHIRCRFNWNEHQNDAPAPKSLHAFKNGWFSFPFNYDPVWGPDECVGKADKRRPEDTAISSPLTDLLSLLG